MRLIESAKESQMSERRRGLTWSGWTLAALVIVGGAQLDGGVAQGKSGVGFGRDTVISTESTGTGSTLEDLAPASEPMRSEGVAAASTIPAKDLPAPSPSPSVRAAVKPVALGVPASLAPGLEEPFEALPPESQPASIGPITLNLGTRVPAALQHDLITVPGGALVTARVVGDVSRDGQLALPDGTRLEGTAVATDQDDRVQMVFRAFVAAGKTVAFRGLALGTDGAMGVPGQVVHRRSKAKKGVGHVLGAIGRIATFGLLGGSADPPSRVAEDVLRSAGRDLEKTELRWNPSTKVVRLPKDSTLTVYLETDVVLP